MNDFYIPVTGIGPGSQPPAEDGAELDMLPMPSDMHTFSMPSIPEPEAVVELVAARQALAQLLALLADYRVEDEARVVDISDFDEANRELIDQVLAVGEVSIIYQGAVRLRAQESVFAGVWRVEHLGEDDRVLKDTIEISPIPALIRSASFPNAAARILLNREQLPPGVLNSPPLVAELNDRVHTYRPGVEPHVINLTLLPQTPEDLAFLDRSLGTGPVTILSRGYGNCRITSTATANVWRVKYFNSRDALILNTIEVVDVPAVAQASQDDIGDSAGRLEEILQVYR